MIRTFILLATVGVAGCSSPEHQSPTYTLYRNSDVDTSLRVHWATFDASESDPNYNGNNCNMAARLLNANLRASAEAEGLQPYFGVGFWCELGGYSERGQVPTAFDATFPTDAP